MGGLLNYQPHVGAELGAYLWCAAISILDPLGIL